MGVKRIYEDFAFIYDRLMYDVDYGGIADYIQKLFKLHGISPEMVADLGCGTGSLCIELCKRGYDVIGIDVSPDMLSCAKTKTLGENLDILYLNQDMTQFELYGTVDAFISVMDSVNYITSKHGMKRFFKLVNNYLNPGGLIIFDINSSYKLEKVLGNNVFYDVSDDISYIWQSSFNRKRKICEFDLTYFVRDKMNYRRFDEVHEERAYSRDELEEAIKQAGMETLAVYDGASLKPADSKSERIFFVCRKP